MRKVRVRMAVLLSCTVVWHGTMAAVPVPGHSGASMLLRPTACFKCSATHTTHTPMSLVSLCEKKTAVPAYTPRGLFAGAIGPPVPCLP